jgi:hypothetical protein
VHITHAHAHHPRVALVDAPAHSPYEQTLTTPHHFTTPRTTTTTADRSVGRQRGAGLGGGNDEREQTINQLLTEMDGFEGNTGVCACVCVCVCVCWE